MTAKTYTPPDSSSQSGTAYKNNIDSAIAVLAELARAFAPHEKAVPDLTVLVDGGRYFVTGAIVAQNQQTVSGFTATASTQRIDRVVVDEVTGVASRVAGAESASPVAPAFPAGKRPVCQIGPFTTSTTAITNSMITDERVIDALAPTTPVGLIQPYCGVSSTVPSGWLFCDGAAVSRTTFSALFAAIVKSGTVTTPIASPGKVNWTAHDRQNNDPVKFSVSGGALPTGITAGTTYYVKNKTANDYEIAATPGGTSINFTGTTTGTQTGIHAPYGDGDGSTTFNTPDLRESTPMGRDAGVGGSAANRVTSAGSGINGDSPGARGGAQNISLGSADVPGISSTPSFSTGRFTPNVKQPSNVVLSDLSISSVHSGSGGAHSKMTPVLVVQAWLIKT